MTERLKTPLYEQHRQLGARLVEFSGWEMPVHYSSILQEHEAVRTRAGLFDVSHMGEFMVKGDDAAAFLQYLVPNDVSRLSINQALYTQLCLPNGNVIDDLLIYRLAEQDYMLVVNAGNIAKDLAWIKQQATPFPHLSIDDKSQSTALLALQGPLAEKILQPLIGLPNLGDVRYYHSTAGVLNGRHCTISEGRNELRGRDESGPSGPRPINWPDAETAIRSHNCLISRTGYTGEDGFEIYCAANEVTDIWNAILEAGKPYGLIPAGLGARDTLRLEAGYCLYGHELDEQTNPLAARLGWTVKLNCGDFIGRDALLKVKEEGPQRLLIGIEMLEPGIPRGGYALYEQSEQIGILTSGGPGPSVHKNIGMGYVAADRATVGRQIQVDIRGKPLAARIVALPFYKRLTSHVSPAQ